jgi:hypothetical protein
VEKNVARAFKSVGIKTVLIFGVHIQTRAGITKGGLTPRQQLATCCLQHFLVMTGNITKKCCRQHVANCCLGVRPTLLCVATSRCTLWLKFSGGRILSDLRNMSREYNTGARHCYQTNFLFGHHHKKVCCTTDREAVVCVYSQRVRV